MTNREKLQALSQRKQLERREEAARREKQYEEEILRDSKLTKELVRFFEEDVAGFRLVETEHEILTDVVDDCYEFECRHDGVPYVQFSIIDDELPGHRLPILVVRFRRERYEFWASSRTGPTESTTLDELRDSVHAAIADLDDDRIGIIIAFARSEWGSDDEEDDDFDDDFESDEWVENSDRLEPARSGQDDRR